jgi:microcystin-dependent protein
MAQPYVGEIRIFAGNFAPSGWQLCEGQLLPISENETLFQLIGTTFGGDGQSTFAVPDLRGRIPVHMGQGPGISQTYILGQLGGVESVTLTTQQIPQHNHPLLANAGTGHVSQPQDGYIAAHRDHAVFSAAAPADAMGAQSILPAGGNQPHTNLPPYLCVNFIISLFGIFPSQT